MEYSHSDDADFNEKTCAACYVSHPVLQESNKLELLPLFPPCTLCYVSAFAPFFILFYIFPGAEEVRLLRQRPLP